MKNLVLLVLIVAFFSQCTQKIEISQWRGPNRDGVYPATNLLKEWPEEGPELAWKFDDLGSGYSSAAVLDNCVITVGTVDSISYVFKFDHTGNLLYKKELGLEWMTNFPGMNSSPLLYDGLGYIIGGLGDLYCFNIADGEIVWQKNVFTEFDGRNNRYGITENLIIDGDKLFCAPGGIENNVIALNRYSGELIWSSKGNGEISNYGSPNIYKHADKKYLLMVMDTTLLSLNVETGKLAWTYPTNTNSYSVPYYRDGFIFINDVKYKQDTTEKYGCVKLKLNNDGNSIQKEWESEFINFGMGDAVVLGDKIYGANWDKRNVYCIDWNTGAPIDSVKIRRMSIVVSADDMIYSYEYNGKFALLKDDAEGFKEVSSFRIEGGIENQHCSFPVIHNGRLYIRHDNSLFVYDITSKS